MEGIRAAAVAQTPVALSPHPLPDQRTAQTTTWATVCRPLSDVEAEVPDPLGLSSHYRKVAGRDMTEVVDVPSLKEICVG